MSESAARAPGEDDAIGYVSDIMADSRDGCLRRRRSMRIEPQSVNAVRAVGLGLLNSFSRSPQPRFDRFLLSKARIAQCQSGQHQKIERRGRDQPAEDHESHRPLDLPTGVAAADGSGSNPNAVTKAVIRMGDKRSEAPLITASGPHAKPSSVTRCS